MSRLVRLWGQSAVLEGIRCNMSVTGVFVKPLRPDPCLRVEVHFQDGGVRWGIMWPNGTVTGGILERINLPQP